MNKFTLLFLTTIITFTFSNCGGGEKAEDSDEIDSVKTEKQTTEKSSEISFQVPSPGEMLSFIKVVGGKNNKNISFLNPISNEKKYTSNKLKVINFGIYSCDLSYCSIFEMGSESLKYFKLIKTMGDEIGVSSAIKPELLKRIEKNIGNSDSLAFITDDVYLSSFETLEGSKQGSTLALVVAGGWLESLFIATNLAVYEENSPVISRLADQKYTLENLIDFFKKYEENQDVMNVRKDFDGLLLEYNKIPLKDAADSKSVNGKKSQDLVMSAEVFKNIAEKIKALRNSYALNN